MSMVRGVTQTSNSGYGARAAVSIAAAQDERLAANFK
jgi:hypothetical protein